MDAKSIGRNVLYIEMAVILVQWQVCTVAVILDQWQACTMEVILDQWQVCTMAVILVQWQVCIVRKLVEREKSKDKNLDHSIVLLMSDLEIHIFLLKKVSWHNTVELAQSDPWVFRYPP